MSKEIYESYRFQLTQFWNGDELALQINANEGGVLFINVTKDSATELIEQLRKWVLENGNEKS